VNFIGLKFPVPVVCSSVPVPAWSGTVIPLRDTPPIHRSGCSSPTQIREYVNTSRTIHSLIQSRWPSVPRGCCTCLEFLATQCSVYVVAGFLLSASKDSSVRCVISSLTLNAILEPSFCTVPLQQFLWQRHLNRIHPFIHSFMPLLPSCKASPRFGWYSLRLPTNEVMARLSWLGWPVTYRDKCRAPGLEPGRGHLSQY